MGKTHKAGVKVGWMGGYHHSELELSRPPVVISSASFKRYDLEDRRIVNNTVSLSSIAGRFIPRSIKNRRSTNN